MEFHGDEDELQQEDWDREEARRQQQAEDDEA